MYTRIASEEKKRLVSPLRNGRRVNASIKRVYKSTDRLSQKSVDRSNVSTTSAVNAHTGLSKVVESNDNIVALNISIDNKPNSVLIRPSSKDSYFISDILF